MDDADAKPANVDATSWPNVAAATDATTVALVLLSHPARTVAATYIPSCD
jgi:hypothetical protein